MGFGGMGCHLWGKEVQIPRSYFVFLRAEMGRDLLWVVDFLSIIFR